MDNEDNKEKYNEEDNEIMMDQSDHKTETCFRRSLGLFKLFGNYHLIIVWRLNCTS